CSGSLAGQLGWRGADLDAMTRGLMPRLGRSVAKVLQHEGAHGTGASTTASGYLDSADQLTDVLSLARADLSQRLPQLGFQAHAGAAAPGDNVAIDQSTARHGCPLSKPANREPYAG